MDKISNASEILKDRIRSGSRLRLHLFAVVLLFFCLALLALLLQFNRQNSQILENSMLQEARNIIELLKTAPFFEETHHLPDSPFKLWRTTVQNGSQTSYLIRLTSLSPLNPLNKPDLVEIKAIHDSQAKMTDSHRFLTQKDRFILRYFSPLTRLQSCQECHEPSSPDGSKVIGGFSITITDRQLIGLGLKRNKIAFFVILAIGIICIVFSMIFILSFFKERHASRNAVRKIANRDFLTNLPNRREGLRRLGEELSKSLRSAQSLTVILFDIDRFKSVNETIGNVGGDEVLQEVASTLAGFMRDYDILSRFGGSEFLIVLPSTTLSDSLAIAERLRVTIEKKSFHFSDGDESSIKITASQGIATLQADESLDNFIARVDQALRAAKDRGRNNVTEA